MDVFTRQEPDTNVPEVGRYFRRNVWGWRPLADALAELTETWANVEHPHTNDGSGLDADDARALADEIDAALASGAVDLYVIERNVRLAAMPRETCKFCEGTGSRRDSIGRQYGLDKPGGCNGCEGLGTVAQWETNYSLDTSDLVEFSAFVRASRGFSIY